MRERLRRSGPVRVACFVLATACGGALLAYVVACAWAMASRPDRFSDGWYAAGGLRRTVLIVAADVLGPHGVFTVAALAVALFVVGFVVAGRCLVRGWEPRRVLAGRVSRRLSGLAVALSLFAVACLATRSARPPRPSFVSPPAASSSRSSSPPAASSSRSSSPLTPAISSPAASPPGSSPSPGPTTARPTGVRPNVVLIGAFGLRFDRLDPRTTPNLVRFAGTSVRFDRAHASTPKPWVSWSSLVSGRDPGRAACEAPPSFDPAPEDTLLSRFAGAGYRVFSSFDHDPEAVIDPRDAVASAIAALDTLGDSAAKEPFFLTVRLASTMPPLLAPSSDRAAFTDPAYRGPFKYAVRESATNADARDLQQWNALYDAAAFAEDAAVGRVLDALDARGLAGRTIVAVVSTHGEVPFGDPSSDPAGAAAVHVPWLIRAPGHAARAVPAIVRDVDFAPTIHDLAGVPHPSDLDGTSLAPLFDGRPVERRVAWSTLRDAREGDACVSTSRVARDERFVLVHRPSRKGAKYTLFDDLVDPSHAVDVSARFPEEVRRLRDALSRGVLRDPAMGEQDEIFVPRATPPSPLRDVVWIDLEDSVESPALRDVLGGDIGGVGVVGGVVFPRTYAVTLDGGPGEVRAMLSGARPRAIDADVAESGEGERRGASLASSLPRLLRGRGYEAHAFVSPARRPSLERALGGATPLHETPAVASDLERFVDEHASSPVFALLAPDGSDAPETVASVVRGLERRGARDRTLVVVTVRPPSHDLPSGRTRRPALAHPTEASMRGALLLSARGVLPETGRVEARVRTIDVVPTIAELLGIEPGARTSGRSLLGLAQGEPEPFERVVLAETVDAAAPHERPRTAPHAPSRAVASLVRGHHHYVATDLAPFGKAPLTPPREWLYDLDRDPRERIDRARHEPDVTADMRARLVAALAGVRVPGDPEDPRLERPPRTVRLRFAGGERPHRVSGTIFVGERPTEPDEVRAPAAGDPVRTTEIVPVGIGREALRVDGDRIDLSFSTTPSSLVGLDVIVRPGAQPMRWTFFLDDQPWPSDATFAGAFGVRAPELRDGLVTPEAHFAAEGRAFPAVDTRHETGLFVVR